LARPVAHLASESSGVHLELNRDQTMVKEAARRGEVAGESVRRWGGRLPADRPANPSTSLDACFQRSAPEALKQMLRTWKAAVFLALMAVLAVAQPTLAQGPASADDAAKFLAGMQPAAESEIARYTRDPNWQQHARYFDSAWDKLNAQQLSKVRAWSDENLKQTRSTLFYTFSGPDFIYADAFFPRASTYILVGLEPVGPIPAINERTRHSLPYLRASLNTILNISYFITSDMGSRLHQGELRGTLPILYIFLARSGKTIREVTLVRFDKEGNVQPTDQRAAFVTNSGVKIAFTDKGGRQQTLYYFSTDLSDSGVNHSGFLKFAEKFAPGDALVKSASYLLHGGNFSRTRKFLLDHSQSIVQDDTGIPLAQFKREEWDLKPFGAYLGPIPIFQGMYQPLLAQLFKQNRPPKLEFGIGYRFRGFDSNLLLAVRRNTVAAQDQ
jgi:hypothetical protein